MSAARRGDPWLDDAKSHDPERLDGLLSTLLEASTPKLQARFEQLATWPLDARIADTAARFFTHCPLRFREQVGVGNAALGCLVLHRAGSSALDALEPSEEASDQIESWRSAVVAAAKLALAPPRSLTEGVTNEPFPEAPREAFQRAWLERAAARRSGDLPFLLERLGTPPGTDVTVRATLLVSFPKTSAIADAAAELTRRPPVKLDGPSPLAAIVALLLVRHGDASHLEAITRLQAVPGFAWLELACSKAPPPLRPLATVPSAPASEAEFTAWLAAAPDDLGRRHAFADWLLERAMPRGEFMALQLADRPLTPKEARRLQTLQNKHERTWLRRLMPDLVRHSVVFEKGVLTELCVVGAAHPIADDPQLATVKRLRLLGTGEDRARDLLTVERLPSLRELVVNAKQLALVPPELARRLSSLGVEARFGTAWSSVFRQLATLELPDVTCLRLLGALRAESVPELAAAPCVRRLERLVVESLTPDALWAVVPSLGPSVVEVHPEPSDHGTVVWTFARQPDGWSLTLRGELPSSEASIRAALLDPLDRLDPAIRARTSFAPAERVAKRVRGWLEHRGVALED